MKAGLHTTLTRKEGQRLPALLAMPESRGARAWLAGCRHSWCSKGGRALALDTGSAPWGASSQGHAAESVRRGGAYRASRVV